MLKGGDVVGLMEITVSNKRTDRKSVTLSDDVTLTSWGAVFVKFGGTDFLPSSFCIESKDTVVYIDPLLVGAGKTADYIFITHMHSDHFSVADIERIADGHTKIICPSRAVKKLKQYDVTPVKPGDVMRFEDIQAEAIPAYSVGFPSHPKNAGNVGYVFSFRSLRIYHAGDTDLVPEISTLKNIDVAMVPIDGGNLTMSTPEAAQLINTLKPQKAVPMHYMVQQGKTEEFAALVDKDIDVLILAE